jgi:hypothetical protein
VILIDPDAVRALELQLLLEAVFEGEVSALSSADDVRAATADHFTGIALIDQSFAAAHAALVATLLAKGGVTVIWIRDPPMAAITEPSLSRPVATADVEALRALFRTS